MFQLSIGSTWRFAYRKLIFLWSRTISYRREAISASVSRRRENYIPVHFLSQFPRLWRHIFRKVWRAIVWGPSKASACVLMRTVYIDTRACIIINLDRTLSVRADTSDESEQVHVIIRAHVRACVRACDFGACSCISQQARCGAWTVERGWMERAIAGPPEGRTVGRWPADVYNLALIAGPGEEWLPVKAELLSACTWRLGSTAIRAPAPIDRRDRTRHM